MHISKDEKNIFCGDGLIDWIEIGFIVGTLVGLLDGLHAIASRYSSASTSLLTLLLSTTVLGIGGGVSLPIILALLKRPLYHEKAQKPIRPWTWFILLYFAIAILGLSLAGFFSIKLLILIFPDFNQVLYTILAFFLTLLFASFNVITKHSIFIPDRKVVTLVFGSLCLALTLAIVILGRGPASSLDSGQLGSFEAQFQTKSERPNILLIVLDTVRADHLSLYGYTKETSPFLSELARESIVYELAISPAPWTLPSHASIFTGQFPSLHQATTEHRLLHSKFITIAEILRTIGYKTVGFSCNSLVGTVTNLNKGFDQFFELFKINHDNPLQELSFLNVLAHVFSKSKKINLGTDNSKVRAAIANDYIKAWLDNWENQGPRQPFFIFINYLDAHLPYVPPEPYKSKFLKSPISQTIDRLCSQDWLDEAFRLMGLRGSASKEEYEQLAELYDGEIAYLDGQVQELINNLKMRGILDNTCLIIVSDHGENLGEHNGLLDHCLSMHQTLLHVPLIIRFPRYFPKGVRYPANVSTMSIFSTILEVAEANSSPEFPPQVEPLPKNKERMDLPPTISEYSLPVWELGLLTSIVPGVDIRPYAIRQRAIQDESWKLVWQSDGKSKLFNLISDPREENPLEPTSESHGVFLLKELNNWVTGLKIPEVPLPLVPPTLDKKTKKSLQSLGYIH
ncbi:MAG: sulfatase [Candidatus Aminicenantales bacterium]